MLKDLKKLGIVLSQGMRSRTSLTISCQSVGGGDRAALQHCLSVFTATALVLIAALEVSATGAGLGGVGRGASRCRSVSILFLFCRCLAQPRLVSSRQCGHLLG